MGRSTQMKKGVAAALLAGMICVSSSAFAVSPRHLDSHRGKTTDQVSAKTFNPSQQLETGGYMEWLLDWLKSHF